MRFANNTITNLKQINKSSLSVYLLLLCVKFAIIFLLHPLGGGNNLEGSELKIKKSKKVKRRATLNHYYVWNNYFKGEGGLFAGAEADNGGVENTIKRIKNILLTGISDIVKNAEIGDIVVAAGETGKSGFGLKHVIEDRYTDDGLQETEIAALIYLVVQAIKTEKPTQRGKIYEFERDGIVAIVKRFDDKGNKKFVLTGFANWDKEKEATDAIKAVIAQYGYTPEFLSFRKQVGAVLTSTLLDMGIISLSTSPAEKSSGDNLLR
ncbi:MAG: hypothetical protein Ta2B_08100 [Termitinemataceae bacterium]|nr:MAG: hypothetical protein Ta2B_08100 [Termitinemataceae bacterium]